MKLKIGLLSAVILGTLAWLAMGGVRESKAYFKTIPEIQTMGDDAHIKHLKVTGYVQDGSIVRNGNSVKFTLVENPGGQNEGAKLSVVYNGIDPLPDTFKPQAQAVADGKLVGNTFEANKVQAKCASKYEAAPPPGAAPVTKPSNI
jgi:cytochrome c-type biogenesis protein CcmE